MVPGGGCARIKGNATEVCGCRVAECGAGSLAADALAWRTGANITLVNGGSIRSSLQAGDVMKKNLVEMLPFMNEVVTLQGVTGHEVLAALQNGISKLGDPNAANDPSGRWLPLCNRYHPKTGHLHTYNEDTCARLACQS